MNFEGDWPHQIRGVKEIISSIESGEKRICVTSPTGGGKSRIILRICEYAVSQGLTVAVFTNRKLLTNQLSKGLHKDGIHVGVRAADFESWTDLDAPVQICSTPTEAARVLRKRQRAIEQMDSTHEEAHEQFKLFPAQLVICDEAHMNKADTMTAILDEYSEKHGATRLGITATPLGIGHLYDKLIIAGNNSELRNTGSLVLAKCYEPAVFDLHKIKRTKTGIYSQKEMDEAVKAIWSQHVVGHIYDHWKKLNPEAKPSLGMAPGVKESLGLAVEFWNKGINAAHISSEGLFVDGKQYTTTEQEDRDEIFSRSKSGEVPIIWNRYCLDEKTEILTREGWMKHSEINNDHRVANWKDGFIYFEKPLEIIKRSRHKNEGMVSLENSRHSIRVTENHDMLYRTLPGGNFLKCKSTELIGRQIEIPVCGNAVADTVPLPSIQKTSASHARRITAISHLQRKKGMSPEQAKEYAEQSITKIDSLKYKNVEDLTLEECEFIGFWLGDGDVHEKNAGGVEYRIRESTACVNIVARIEFLLKSMNVDSVRSEVRGTFNGEKSKASHYVWRLCRGTGTGKIDRRGLFYLEYMLNKDGSDYLHCLNEDQFSALLSGLWMANGMQHLDSVGLPKTRLRICASIKRRNLFDSLQAIATCRGYCATIREYANNRKDSTTNNRILHLNLTRMTSHTIVGGNRSLQLENDFRDELVWCVRTSSGNIVTRRNGSVTVMGNCLREALDLPWLEHLILATPIASILSYIQVCGRVLRASPSTGKTHAIICDHAGSIRTHGSPNLDRDQDWLKYFKEQEDKMSKDRIDRLRDPDDKEAEPITCPNCGAIRKTGRKCLECGFQHDHSTRKVIQENGTLKPMTGDVFPKRVTKMKYDTLQKWTACYFRCKNAKKPMTFKQARALFKYEEHYWPPMDLHYMPKNKSDWGRRINDVAKTDLYQDEKFKAI